MQPGWVTAAWWRPAGALTVRRTAGIWFTSGWSGSHQPEEELRRHCVPVKSFRSGYVFSSSHSSGDNSKSQHLRAFQWQSGCLTHPSAVSHLQSVTFSNNHSEWAEKLMDTLRNVVWTRCNSINLGLKSANISQKSCQKMSLDWCFLQSDFSSGGAEHHRLHVKPSWSAEKSDFFRGNSELSVRRLPAETSADTVTKIGVPHMDELCDHVMLLHIVTLLLFFLFKYNSGEAASGGQGCRKQAHPAAAAAVAGVCSIPMTVQIRGESAITRQQCVHSQPEEKKRI